MLLTLLILLTLFLAVAACIVLFRRKHKARQQAIAVEMERQRKATQLLGQAALAVERGDRATADHFIQEANQLLKPGSIPSSPTVQRDTAP